MLIRKQLRFYLLQCDIPNQLSAQDVRHGFCKKWKLSRRKVNLRRNESRYRGPPLAAQWDDEGREIGKFRTQCVGPSV